MNDRRDSQLESVLREHLASELDSQLGRSAGRFLTEINGAAPPAQMRLVGAPTPAPHRRLQLFGWSVGIAGAAVAAGIAIVMVLPSLLDRSQPATNPPTIVMKDLDPAPIVPTSVEDVARDVEHGLSWRTVDRGTVYLDNEIPLRSLFREQVETVSWYDPKREAHVQMEIPRDQVMLVGYNSY